jgi:RHS repeat-associated protein
MVAINKILLPECTDEGCGGDTDVCTDSRVHRRNAENRVPATRNHCRAPTPGRWMEQDPARYINGANTYQFVMSSPVGNVDAEGTQDPDPAYPGWGGWSPSTGSTGCARPTPVTGILAMIKTYSWTSIVRARPKPWANAFVKLTDFLLGDYVAEHETVDFKVAVSQDIPVKRSVVGPREPGGEPDSGDVLTLHFKQTNFELPRLHLLWSARHQLKNGATCYKTTYLVQRCACCGGRGGSKNYYVPVKIWGTAKVDGFGHLYCAGTDPQQAAVLAEVRRDNAAKTSICGEGTTDRPSGLRILKADTSYGIHVPGRRP